MSFYDKIIARSDLARHLPSLARPVVFTNGVFDILRPGHVDYLAQARALGNSLVLGLKLRQFGPATWQRG